MRKYGLIGQSLKHSFSQSYFEKKFREEKIKASYVNLEFDVLEDLDWMREKEFDGCNVTMPYKQKAFELVDELSDEAEKVGAINTIKNVSGKLIGYNTDVIGFEQSLLSGSRLESVERRALVLGTGGAAKAVKFVLDKLGFSVAFVSRSNGDFKYEELDESIISSVGLIVNTTPLGMKPQADDFPDIPYDFLNSRHLIYDLIYNPERTLFLQKAETRQASIMNGLEMLKLQAEASWKIWNT